MLSRISQFAASKTALTATAWVACLVLGALAYTTWLPREGFPAVEVPIATGSGEFFSSDPTDVVSPAEADEFASELTDALLEDPTVSTVSSFARPNGFVITVELTEEFSASDAQTTLDESFEGIGAPDNLDFRSQPLNLALLLGKYDSLVGLRGGSNLDELIQSAEATLEFYEAQDEIASAEVYPVKIFVEETGEARQIGFNQLTGQDDGAKEFSTAVTIGLIAESNVDSLDLREGTDRAIAEIADGDVLPAGTETFVAFDYAPQIEQQIGSLQSNVLTGIAAVALVALLLISWRSSIIAAAFILTVIATTLAILYFVGITLNTISLFGVILALGLFVDDAIVISESIYAFRQKGSGYKEVIGEAIKRVGSASVSGTLTTLLVFAPMLAISGLLGRFVRILPISVMVALAVSLVLSLILIPFAARFLIISQEPTETTSSRIQQRVADFLASKIGAGKRWAAAGVGTSVLMIVASIVVIAPNVEFNIFPPVSDSIDLSITVEGFEDPNDIEAAEALTLEINQAAADALGSDLESGYLYEGSGLSALGFYRLTPIGERDPAPDLVAQKLEPIEEAYADQARVSFDVVSPGPPDVTFPYIMQVKSEDREVALAAAQSIAADIEAAVFSEGQPGEYRAVEVIINNTERIARLDGDQFLEIAARFDTDNVTAVTTGTQLYLEELYGIGEDSSGTTEAFDALGLEQDGISFDFGIESDNQESFASLPAAFGIALLAMLVLLVVQFRSWVQWILVFLAIPFSLFGVFGGLWLTGNSISFFTMIGILALMGIAVNNTILLVDFANQERNNGATPTEAIQSAVRRRFRPLVATTITTLAGLLPLALSDPFWEGLSYTIIFGLISSTFLVLVSFPYYYLGFEKLRARRTSSQ